ncbi:NUDIX domain-containing protein [Paracoccus xiamenensis]|uniref:NUDIX domain-containing protein n=1 Tax=Paracoccus xiamenensis TaxID=2714901 RepID=UPI00140DE8EE|nr:NUDIX domain-containing protein [Paracoccus xiamenensis]NHF72055.1 NUDIX domain-containing protein [Paracoccus xiamenensis]
MTDRSMILAGPLATPALLEALGLRGEAMTLPGSLSGGADAGLGGDWPAYLPGAGRIAAVRVAPVPELDSYIEVMQLSPVEIDGMAAWGFGAGEGAEWTAASAGLMARVARSLLARLDHRTPAQLHARLRRIAEIVAGTLRARDEVQPAALLPEPDRGRVEVISRHERYGRYFAVEEIALRHRLYSGGWSPVLEREVFVSADAALLLPYDPVLDSVLLISQFRMGPLARGQAQAWMLEPVAGRVDAGESPADAARREAVEEAGLQVGKLYPLPGHYPTPGANSEFFYPFVATVDLSGRASGQGFGLEEEGEDIATHIIPRAELIRLALEGQLQCGPLVTMALWLDRQAGLIRAEHAGADRGADLAGS